MNEQLGRIDIDVPAIMEGYELEDMAEALWYYEYPNRDLLSVKMCGDPLFYVEASYDVNVMVKAVNDDKCKGSYVFDVQEGE